MNPNPLASLNHFTLPCISVSSLKRTTLYILGFYSSHSPKILSLNRRWFKSWSMDCPGLNGFSTQNGAPQFNFAAPTPPASPQSDIVGAYDVEFGCCRQGEANGKRSFDAIARSSRRRYWRRRDWGLLCVFPGQARGQSHRPGAGPNWPSGLLRQCRIHRSRPPADQQTGPSAPGFQVTVHPTQSFVCRPTV